MSSNVPKAALRSAHRASACERSWRSSVWHSRFQPARRSRSSPPRTDTRRMAATGSRSRSRPISGCRPSAERCASAGLSARTSASTAGRPALPNLAHSSAWRFRRLRARCVRSVVGGARIPVDRCLPQEHGSSQRDGPGGTLRRTRLVFRVAPGLGYQIYSGAIAGIPTTVDARAGFSVLTWDASAKIEESPFSGVSVSHSFVQPWAGFRADFYPWRDWRFELGAMAEGFGVNGGVWGWGASALVSYSISVGWTSRAASAR